MSQLNVNQFVYSHFGLIIGDNKYTVAQLAITTAINNNINTIFFRKEFTVQLDLIIGYLILTFYDYSSLKGIKKTTHHQK